MSKLACHHSTFECDSPSQLHLVTSKLLPLSSSFRTQIQNLHLLGIQVYMEKLNIDPQSICHVEFASSH